MTFDGFHLVQQPRDSLFDLRIIDVGGPAHQRGFIAL